MSKKRTSSESSDGDCKSPEDRPDSVFGQDGDAKREKLMSLRDTEFQGLPNELVELILIEAVVVEVLDMKLSKRVWKEKADLAMSRLETVCLKWSSILESSFIRSKIYRTLDCTDHKIRLEILYHSPLHMPVSSATALKDEIFLLCKPRSQGHCINVYDRNNMADVKEVIPLSGLRPQSISACSSSNCVYLLNKIMYRHVSVLRISRDEENQFTVSPIISGVLMPNPNLSVAPDGTLVVSRQHNIFPVDAISVYDANGTMLHEFTFSTEKRLTFGSLGFFQVLPKPNGNLVFRSMRTTLKEIDMAGTVLRESRHSIGTDQAFCDADTHGHTLVAGQLSRMELLDSEFNRLSFSAPQLDEDRFRDHRDRSMTPYNVGREEVLAITEDDSEEAVLTIFKFTED